MKIVASLLSFVLLICSLARAQNKPADETELQQWTLRRTFSGHTDSVHSVAFSPDGKTVASASWDRTIQLWDVETGEKKQAFTHGYHPHRVMFSPDGQFLYSSGGDGTIKKWNLQTERAKALVSSRNEIVNFSLSSDGTLLACDCRMKTAEVLKTGTGGRKFSAPHGDYIWGVALSPDDSLLAVVGGDKPSSVAVWNVKTGRLVRKIAGVKSAGSVAFSPDSTILALAGQPSGNVKLFNAATGELLQTLTTASDSYLQLVFSPDGRWLAVNPNLVGRIYFYDLMEKRWAGMLNSDRSLGRIAFSPDAKRVAVASYSEKTVTIWSNPAFDTNR